MIIIKVIITLLCITPIQSNQSALGHPVHAEPDAEKYSVITLLVETNETLG